MLIIPIIMLAGIVLFGLLYSENKGNRGTLLATKTVLSSLFILAVLVQPHPTPRYYHFLFAGLSCCLWGDVLLALQQQRAFLFGLVSFLLGNIFYIFGFFSLSSLSQWTLVGLLTFAVISTWIYTWLRPHVGSMKTPVLVYVIVITVMVSAAWSVLGDPHLARPGRIMVFLGGISFYCSDVFVARDRFLRKEFVNRLLGLPLYYAAQFLLAFSVGLLG
jgi:uncharacterized membrane protein YhhN